MSVKVNKTVSLDVEVYGKLDKEAKRLNISINKLIENIVTETINKSKKGKK